MKTLPAIAASAVALAALMASAPVLEARLEPVSAVEAKLAFLKDAKVVSARRIGKGVTGALRLTLSDGTRTHDASFQSVDQKTRPLDLSRGIRTAGELQFVDSYRYNIGAWEIARLLGLDDMMPPTVQRAYRGRLGALSWWVDDVLMDEAERQRTQTTPPEGQTLQVARQRERMRVFAELVRDTDRNKGNVLFTDDWRLVMIDFTRAFRLEPTLRLPDTLIRCDRDLLARLRGLERETLKQAAGRYLSIYEIDALLARRDLVVARFDYLVASRGEAAVLY